MPRHYSDLAAMDCPNCHGFIQAPLYTEDGEVVENEMNWEKLIEINDNHKAICSSQNPYNDVNLFYGDRESCKSQSLGYCEY